VNDAADYLAFVKACIVAHPQIEHCLIVREEAQGDMGLLRYRLTLRGGDLLEMFERFQVREGCAQVTKYSFHWQSGEGQVRKRWDNAAHHPEVPTRPHHMHDGAEGNVRPHAPISAEEVLAYITSARDATSET